MTTKRWSSHPYPHQNNILSPRAFPFPEPTKITKSSRASSGFGHPAALPEHVVASQKKDCVDIQNHSKSKISESKDDELTVDKSNQSDLSTSQQENKKFSYSNTPVTSI